MNKIDQSEELNKWLEGKPKVIKDLVAAISPYNSYYMKNDDVRIARYYPYSYNENGTITVTKVYDMEIMPTINVFGVKPEDLVIAEVSV